MTTLIVGASAAGLATAEALRRKGYTGRLTVLGAEPHLPYDRPPLSKQVLSGAWEPARAQLRSAEALAALDAEFVARYHRDGELVGVLGSNMPKLLGSKSTLAPQDGANVLLAPLVTLSCRASAAAATPGAA